MTDKEYLKKEIMTDVIYKITDEVIEITTEGTNFVKIARIKPNILEKELKELYKNVVKLAKLNKVKISYKNKFKATIESCYHGYINILTELNNAFNKALVIAKRIEQRKLHYGYRDDIVLQELHDEIKIYQTYHYRDSDYSKINEIFHQLKTLEQELQEDGCHFTKIVI